MKRRTVAQGSRAFRGVESLEGRRLLSASMGHGGFQGPGGGGGGPAGAGSSAILTQVAYSEVSTTVQAGLAALATTDGLATPATTANVRLNDANGVETYSLVVQTTGTVSILTVDSAGNPVDAPTLGTTTFAGVPTAASAEISAIASAFDLTTPTDTTVVRTVTTAAGTSYSVRLASSQGWGGQSITVDAAGNPIGDQTVTFAVLPTAIQTGINANLPTGATALASDSDQIVRVQTVDGVVLYSTFVTSDDASTDNSDGDASSTVTFDHIIADAGSLVTVDITGAKAALPSHTTTTFGAIPAAAQAAIQALATGHGGSVTLEDSFVIQQLTESNGTILYTAVVTTARTTASGRSVSGHVAITVDGAGNVTTLPTNSGIADQVGGHEPGNPARNGGAADGSDQSTPRGDQGDHGGSRNSDEDARPTGGDCGGPPPTDDSGTTDDGDGSSTTDDGSDDSGTTDSSDTGATSTPVTIYPPAKSTDDGAVTTLAKSKSGTSASLGSGSSTATTVSAAATTSASTKAARAAKVAAKAAKAAAAKVAKAAKHAAKIAAAAVASRSGKSKSAAQSQSSSSVA